MTDKYPMEIRFRWLLEASGSVSPFERLVKFF
jgi:hypothetical protein